MEKPEFYKEHTISQVQEEMRKELYDGVTCPCCTQHSQAYRRPLTSSMVYGLILLSQSPEQAKGIHTHVEDYLKKMDCPSSVRGDIAKLRFWGLIEPLPGEREDKNPQNGFYKVLEKGFDFINGRVMVPQAVKVYNNRFLAYDGKMIDVRQAIKSKFNYEALMAGKIDIAA
jgi:hypothetical protein